MSEPNLYAAPTTTSAAPSEGNAKFLHLTDKQLKKLRTRSSNVSAIAVIAFLGAVGFGFAVYSGVVDIGGGAAGYGVTALLLLVGVGLSFRTNWGRVLGLIFCLPLCLHFPIGTLIGAAGLFALGKAPELFGQNRFLHKEIDTEVKRRQRELKALKKQQRASPPPA